MYESFIIDTVRVPRAKAQGKNSAYSDLNPIDLLSPLFTALKERNQLDTAEVDQVILGCVTQTGGQGANIGKIAPLYAGWSEKVSGASINRFCCSGLDALNFASSNIMSGIESLVVAGGVEKISSVPMFGDKGAWFSDPKVMQATRFIHMGMAADLIACQNNYSRHQLDELAIQSHERAHQAITKGHFKNSIIPIPIPDSEKGKDQDKNEEVYLSEDNAVRANLDTSKLAALPASFTDFVESTQHIVNDVYPQVQLKALHSAANSPALVDGASLVLLANKQKCQTLGLKPRARVTYFANASDEPLRMLTGHIRATEKLLKARSLKAADIDLWEVNESFASSLINFQEHFNISSQQLNTNGGAIALGHPLGATGGNLIGILLDELERQDKQSGIVSICGGAGVGVTTLIEKI